jgi:uncharacterized membrane protein YkvA (DUF1232 family)
MKGVSKLTRATAGYKVVKNKSIPTWIKVFVVMALLYGVSPIDLIPDLIPVIGLIDDIVVAITLLGPALIGLLSHFSKRRAERPPQTR